MDYSSHVGTLTEALNRAGTDRIAQIQEGSIHTSFHFQSVGPQWWDIPARGSVAYAVISENQPEELLNGRPDETLRRSNVVQIHGWIVYFFPDVQTIHCSPDLPDCYKNTVTTWLDTIR